MKEKQIEGNESRGIFYDELEAFADEKIRRQALTQGARPSSFLDLADDARRVARCEYFFRNVPRHYTARSNHRSH